jgi:hypothetical protein
VVRRLLCSHLRSVARDLPRRVLEMLAQIQARGFF